jgi:DNA-binding LacI/PurR family transcriptional regulator
MVSDAKIDGLIAMGQLDEPYMKFIKESSSVPMMLLDSYDASGKDSVISDGYYGMYAMTDLILSLGHRDICFVGSVGATSSITDRYYGFCKAVSAYGIEPKPEMIIEDRDEGGLMSIALPDRLPTAFVCNCDIAAYKVMELLKARGVRVPEDASIVGFDNYAVDARSEPEITTYSVDIAGMARCCVERMLRKISASGYTTNLKIISGGIVVKGSAIPIGADAL